MLYCEVKKHRSQTRTHFVVSTKIKCIKMLRSGFNIYARICLMTGAVEGEMMLLFLPFAFFKLSTTHTTFMNLIIKLTL